MRIDTPSEFTAYVIFERERLYDDEKLLCPSDGQNGVCIGLYGDTFYIEYWAPERKTIHRPLKRGLNIAGLACRQDKCVIMANEELFEVRVTLHSKFGIFEAGWDRVFRFMSTPVEYNVVGVFDVSLLWDKYVEIMRSEVTTNIWIKPYADYLEEFKNAGIRDVLFVGTGTVTLSDFNVYFNTPKHVDLVVVTNISFVDSPVSHLRYWSRFGSYVVALPIYDSKKLFQLGGVNKIDEIYMFNIFRKAGLHPLAYDKINGTFAIAAARHDPPAEWYPVIIYRDVAEDVLRYVRRKIRIAELGGSVVRRGYAISDLDIMVCTDRETALQVANELNDMFSFPIDVMLEDVSYRTRMGIFKKVVKPFYGEFHKICST